MRRRLIALLLAGVLLPASAQSQDDQERGPIGRAERSSSADDSKANRPERPERSQRSERAPRAEHAGGPNAGADRGAKGASNGPARGGDTRVERQDRAQQTGRPDRGERPVPVRQQITDAEPVVQPQATTAEQPVQGTQSGSDSLLDGFRRVARGETDDDGHDGHDGHDGDKDHHWSKDWRKDHRYDWWSYRNRYRSVYRLGRYYDPYGWGYRRWAIGYSMWPSHYSSGYWLNDPWMYRLPPAYGPYRWVRYYDDALLVNIYTGHVVDVVYNFFW